LLFAAKSLIVVAKIAVTIKKAPGRSKAKTMEQPHHLRQQPLPPPGSSLVKIKRSG
jgi:hypothetical protein